MSLHIDHELSKFLENIEELREHMQLTHVCEYAYILTPKNPLAVPAPKKIALTVSGTIHGNETVGVGVLNEFIKLLASRTVDCRVPLALFVGNPEAARAGTRFIERDLNRSFASKGTNTMEERRAQELLPLLANTMWFVDLHQTNRPSEEPFFIFPYAQQSFAFAQKVSPQTTIVTHVDEGFSTEGLCSDEFVNQQGGIGITLESGLAGLHPLQIGFGLKTVLNALSYVQRTLEKTEKTSTRPAKPGQVYLIKETIACPQQGTVKLTPNLVNMQSVSKGDPLAEIDGKPVLSPRTGKIIFPNYRAETTAPGKRPGELMRLVAEVDPESLHHS